jgi:hypothetical protein
VLKSRVWQRTSGSAREVARKSVELADGRIVALPDGVAPIELRAALDSPASTSQHDNADDPEEGTTMNLSDDHSTLPPGNLVPLREATRQCRDLIGNVEIVKVDGRNYVRRADLERMVGPVHTGGGMGAGDRISGAIERAQDQRARASREYTARKRREASDAGRRRAGR